MNWNTVPLKRPDRRRWVDRCVPRRQRRRSEDATESLIWLVARGCQIFADLHCLGFALILASFGGFLSRKVGFLPLFTATAWALVTQARIFIRAASLKLQKPGTKDYGSMDSSRRRISVIHEDALPLLRRGIVATIASLPGLGLVLAAQILFFQGKNGLGCLVAMQTAILAFAIALKGRSISEVPASQIDRVEDVEALQLTATNPRPSGLLSGTFQALIWLWLVLLLVVGSSSNAFVPLWIAWLLFLRSLVTLLRGHCYGRYNLARGQLISVGLYLISAVAMALAVALGIGVPLTDLQRRPQAAVLVAIVGIVAGAIPFHNAFTTHALQLTKTRGHGPPLPLATTRDGYWAIDGSGESFWFLLGSFHRIAPASLLDAAVAESPQATRVVVGTPRPTTGTKVPDDVKPPSPPKDLSPLAALRSERKSTTPGTPPPLKPELLM